MPKTSRQKFKCLEKEKSIWDEIKSIFHNFWTAIIEANNKKFGRWEPDFKSVQLCCTCAIAQPRFPACMYAFMYVCMYVGR